MRPTRRSRRKSDVDGYYVRIAPPDTADARLASRGIRADQEPSARGQQRAGRADGQPRRARARALWPARRRTIRASSTRCGSSTRCSRSTCRPGRCWRRYNGDGYGEHEDGRPFDGTGIGRPWPLLTGERAHYELAAGNRTGAQALLAALEGFASDGHLLPEQVWDAPDIPERELFRGRPSGSAMPLVWAHAEHVKLLRSLADDRVFDMPPQPRQRYQIDGTGPRYAVWRFNHKCRRLPKGRTLRVEVIAAASVHWSTDGWRTVHDTPTQDSGFGIHLADLDTAELASGGEVVFTLYWPAENRWEGVNYLLTIELIVICALRTPLVGHRRSRRQAR